MGGKARELCVRKSVECGRRWEWVVGDWLLWGWGWLLDKIFLSHTVLVAFHTHARALECKKTRPYPRTRITHTNTRITTHAHLHLHPLYLYYYYHVCYTPHSRVSSRVNTTGISLSYARHALRQTGGALSVVVVVGSHASWWWPHGWMGGWTSEGAGVVGWREDWWTRVEEFGFSSPIMSAWTDNIWHGFVVKDETFVLDCILLPAGRRLEVDAGN